MTDNTQTDYQPASSDLSSQPSRTERTKLKLIGLATLLLISVSAGFLGGWLGAKSRGQQSLNNAQKAEIVSTESELINDVAEEISPSVVSIDVTAVGEAQDIFGLSQPIERRSAGTGVIISEDGIVVTNRHVIPAGTPEVSITLSDGTELENVRVIGRTSESDSLDIAFLKIEDKEGKTLKAAKIGDSGQVKVGEKVIAIGNALGQFQNTVTSGIISGFGRSVIAGDSNSAETLQNLFQTDAAINEGNSGGPLVNMMGEVIGINTAIAGEGENIGFAIPVNDIKGLIDSVLATGRVERPFLGVRYVSLTDDYAEEFDLSTKRGAFVIPSSDGQPSIVPDSPAAKAGLKERDIITKVNGTEIDERNSLTSLVGRHKVGEEVTLVIVRDGNEQEIKVKLEAQN